MKIKAAFACDLSLSLRALEVERLARKEPPSPPKEFADWVVVAPDPSKRPEPREHVAVQEKTLANADLDDLHWQDERVGEVLEAQNLP